MNVAYHIVIPARMAAERLPGKPLAEVAGRSLLEHVWRQALKSAAQTVVIATDDERIRIVAREFGAQVVMTSLQHPSGSDRSAECVTSMGWPPETVIVNLQGDEPLMPPECLDQVARLLASDESAQAASLYWPLDNSSDIRDPNVVKLVTAPDGTALLFSRSVIPYPRAWGSLASALEAGVRWKRHIGLYAYRAASLQAFSQHPPTLLEQAEKLEQLRILETGGRMVMAEACLFVPPGVDTPEDLERVRRLIK
ncbi:MAG TPA: 3-deoxy-manno-octulosonate cytidylyltransferase [Xanthomonadales bacterium]|nr:3-deoxy-manno-octulosonate cytidylyltransferase [Xanthomonadales bacterium]